MERITTICSFLLRTLYWMMQCFAFQCFKCCARICRGSWEERKNETEDGPDVWGPDSSARERGAARRAVKGHSRTQQRQQPECSTAHCREPALSQGSVENNSKKELRSKKSTWLETMLQAGTVLLQEQQPLSAGSSWPQPVPAPTSPWHCPEPSSASSHALVPLPQLSHIPAASQAESNSRNLFLHLLLPKHCTNYLNGNSPTIYFQLPAF